jgi:glycosyltransferase involved in cell wall biosynthesis
MTDVARATRLNLLLLNLRMDADDDNLGFTTVWARGLARRFGRVHVVTMSIGTVDVEHNADVHSLGAEEGRSRARRLAAFYRIVLRLAHSRSVDVCLVHQGPIFATLVAPVARAHGIPVLLSYGHGTVSRQLRIAHAVADRCISSSPSGFNLPSDKLFIVGQGIDTTVFHPPASVDPDYATTALTIGRTTPVKRLDEITDAVAILRDRGRALRLRIVGGPSGADDERYVASLRARVRRLGVEELVRFEGPTPFRDVPEWYRRGCVFVSASENRSLDKAYLEAMASHCIPVSRNESFAALARARGYDWLVPGPGPEGIADTIGAVLDLPARERQHLQRRLRTTVHEDHEIEGLMDRVTRHLIDLADRRRGGARPGAPGAARPRVLFVSSDRLQPPFASGVERKWTAVGERVDFRMVARRRAGAQPDPRFRLVDVPVTDKAYHLMLPFVVRQEMRRLRPDVLVCQTPYEAFVLRWTLRRRRGAPKVVVDLHGDWRTAARVYGSPVRRVLAPLADRAALAGLRWADGTRALTQFTQRLAEEATGRPPLGTYPTHFDFESFTARPSTPLPPARAVAWVGVLERAKNIDGFAAAWRLLAERVPDATLTIVGQGHMQDVVDELVRDYPGRVTAIPSLAPAGVAALLDASRVLALPSRSEGTPRVIMEAFARGRPVVASAVGGVPDMIEAGRNGLLVDPEDASSVADALAQVLEDDALAQRLGAGALQDSADRFHWPVERYADSMLRLFEAVLGRREPDGPSDWRTAPRISSSMAP